MNRAFDPDHPEWMDLPSPDPKDLQDDLTNLGIINRYFGGTKAVQKILFPFAHKLKKFRVVDLATGYGDHPRQMVQWANQKGFHCTVIAVDNQMDTLKIAQQATSPQTPIFFVQADIRRLPFKNQSTDLVFCSLALHHFAEADAVGILEESRRLAQHGAICMDLVRSRLAYIAVWLLTQFILRARMTKHDARLSIQRAFTRQELKILAHQAGWPHFWHTKLPWFRQAIGFLKNHEPN